MILYIDRDTYEDAYSAFLRTSPPLADRYQRADRHYVSRLEPPFEGRRLAVESAAEAAEVRQALGSVPGGYERTLRWTRRIEETYLGGITCEIEIPTKCQAEATMKDPKTGYEYCAVHGAQHGAVPRGPYPD